MGSILFFDDWGLHYKDNVERHMGDPELVSEATLEDERVATTWQGPTVWYEPAENAWRALYLGTAYHHREPDKIAFYPPADWWEEFDRQMIDHTHVVLYAESPDGIDWRRPDVSAESDVVTRVARNQVFGGDIPIDETTEGGPQIEGGPVYIDEHESDRERRFKFLYSYSDESGTVENRIATSPDGKQWRVEADFHWGTDEYQSTDIDHPMPVYYNSERNTYVIAHRFGFGDRRVALTETPDFETYTRPELALAPDPEDPSLSQFYGMPVHPYDDLYLGFLWRIRPDPHEIGHKWLGRVESTLVYSYDGKTFNRATHDPFLPTQELGSPGGGSIYPTSMTVDRNEIRIYSGGSTPEHFRDQELDADNAAIMVHRLRKDGFFYLEPSAGRGEIATRPLVFEDDDLRINVTAPTGRVRVQLVDTTGRPIEGFGYDQSIPFTGDAVAHVPEWEGGNDLRSITGDPVHVAIELVEARLYAIRGAFERRPIAPDKILDRY